MLRKKLLAVCTSYNSTTIVLYLYILTNASEQLLNKAIRPCICGANKFHPHRPRDIYLLAMDDLPTVQYAHRPSYLTR